MVSGAILVAACGPRTGEVPWPPGTRVVHAEIRLTGVPIGDEIVRRAASGADRVRVEHVQHYHVRVRDEDVAWTVTVRGEVDHQGRIRKIEVQRDGPPRAYVPPAGAHVYWLDEAAPLLARVEEGETTDVRVFWPALGEATLTRLEPAGSGQVRVDAGVERALLDVDGRGHVHGTRAGAVREVEVPSLERRDPPDLLALLRLPVAPWPGARHAGQAVWKIDGIPPGDLDFPPWQQASGDRVLVRRPLPAEIPLDPAPPGPALRPWLLPGPGIAVGTPALRAELATALAGKEDARARLTALVHHVHERIAIAAHPGPPDAEAALRSGEGDCNEQAAALVALARTAGWPARAVTGWVYLDEGLSPGLYPHAWAEIWVGDPLGWIPVDPILDEVVADAGHVRVRDGMVAIRRPTVTLSDSR